MTPWACLASFGARVLVLCCLCGACGCNDDAPTTTCACAETPPIDAPLMAFLSKARAAHHHADAKEQESDLPGAVTALEQITTTTLGDMATRPEAREVLADTLARLSDLRGQLGNHDKAEQDIEAGLEFAPRDSYFEGHLYEMQGVNEERRAKVLAESHNTAGAESARRKAYDSFNKAIDIQDRVIRKELSDAGGSKQ